MCLRVASRAATAGCRCVGVDLSAYPNARRRSVFTARTSIRRLCRDLHREAAGFRGQVRGLRIILFICNRVPCEVIKNVTRDDDSAGRERERERESCCCSLSVFDVTRDAVFGECGKNRLKRFYTIGNNIIIVPMSLLFVGSASLFFCATVYGRTAGRDNRLTDSTWPTDYSGDGGGGWLSRRARPHSLPRQWPTRSHRHDRRDRSILAHHKNI